MLTLKASHLQIAILSVMTTTREPWTGYDLHATIREKTGCWSHQQVYRELKRLNNMGALKFKDVPQLGKPDRKDYTLNEYDVDYANVGTMATQVVVGLDDHFLTCLKVDALEEQLSKLKEDASNNAAFWLKAKIDMLDFELGLLQDLL